jgi:hypothetical protein
MNEKKRIIRGSSVGSKATNASQILHQMEIEKELKESEKLYEVVQVLGNGVKMPGTYLDMGVKDILTTYKK